MLRAAKIPPPPPTNPPMTEGHRIQKKKKQKGKIYLKLATKRFNGSKYWTSKTHTRTSAHTDSETHMKT